MSKTIKDNAQSIKKATVEMIQEDRFTSNGLNTRYYLYVNGLYEEGTLCNDEETCRTLFNTLIEKGTLNTKTVVLRKEIKQGGKNG